MSFSKFFPPKNCIRALYIVRNNKKKRIMEKKKFRELLLAKEIKSVIILSYPDWNGGRQCGIMFNTSLEEVRDDLSDYEYIEWWGDATEVLRHRKMVFYDHFEPFHEEAYDVERTLEELILERFEEIKEMMEAI